MDITPYTYLPSPMLLHIARVMKRQPKPQCRADAAEYDKRQQEAARRYAMRTAP